jgi:uncharacterized iron-regulated membrane protein
MTVVIPLILCAVFCALFAGAYIWMRRSTFGESWRQRGK